MPMVRVQYRQGIVTGAVANRLSDGLPRIIAEALTCVNPQGYLSADDVEVEVKAMDKGLRTDYDLHIDVEANDYPDRRSSLEQRSHQIAQKVRAFLDGIYEDVPSRPKGWVWVKLFPAHWVEL